MVVERDGTRRLTRFTPHSRPSALAPYNPHNAARRRFGVCAAAEMDTLGVMSADRKGGIPTIAVFRASDGALLTMDGVKDVNEAGPGAVDRWQSVADSASVV